MNPFYNIRMPAAIRAEVIPDRTELRLSDSLRLEIAIEGPAPLRIELPKEWLAEASAGLWKMQPLGSPVLVEIPEGQRWSQSFRLDPYVPGSPIPLIFVPVKVNEAEVNLPSFSIVVTTSIPRASVDEARPITGMEIPPPRPPGGTSGDALIVVVVTMLVALLVVFRLRHRPRVVPEPTPGELALAALRQLETPANSFESDLAKILREWLERGRGIPAKSHTAAELRAKYSEFEPFLAILDRCDRSQFSGEAMAIPEREDLRNRALHFVTDATTPREPKP